jgi:hypothetical protein
VIGGAFGALKHFAAVGFVVLGVVERPNEAGPKEVEEVAAGLGLGR